MKEDVNPSVIGWNMNLKSDKKEGNNKKQENIKEEKNVISKKQEHLRDENKNVINKQVKDSSDNEVINIKTRSNL